MNQVRYRDRLKAYFKEAYQYHRNLGRCASICLHLADKELEAVFGVRRAAI